MKINLTLSLLAAIGSTVLSLGSAVWFGSSRNTDINNLKADMEDVVKSDKDQSSTLTRLDERTLLILESVRRIEQQP